jgi:hypothetical protein
LSSPIGSIAESLYINFLTNPTAWPAFVPYASAPICLRSVSL